MTVLHVLGMVCITIASANVTDPLVVVKDIRLPGSRSALSVVFCARDGLPGHAFVVLGKEDEQRQMSTIEAFGFYPDSGKGVFGPVPGTLANEFVRGKGVASAACRLIVKVDPAQFEQVDKVRKQWAAKKDYHLLETDCITFADRVAGTLKLKTPLRGRTDKPATFVEKLVEANK